MNLKNRINAINKKLSLNQQGAFAQWAVRYSPSACVGCERNSVFGNPNLSRASTSHIERQNLTVRMSMRRMTRLTNAFSKKWVNLKWSYALQFAYYNFCRIHQTLKVTPAMEAGIADHVWSLSEVIELAK
jgi:hypothetical protein